MNGYADRQSNCYLLFLAVFSAVLLGAACLFCLWQAETSQRLLLQNDRAAAAYLLEQGVSPGVIAAAITHEGESEAGNDLLEKAGLTENTALSVFPHIGEQMGGMFAILIVFVLAMTAMLFGGTTLFLVNRGRLFEEATGVIANYTEGDFFRRLPETGEGMIHRLFVSVDALAAVLRSKEEKEREAKEFLKNTISDISHQLKTPLAALCMYNEIISDETDHKAVVLEFTRKAEISLARMEQLIQSLLKITRLDAGSIVFEKEQCTVGELVRLAMENLLTRAEQEDKEILISGSMEEEICCDIQWTSEAIANLIKNAIDHSPDGGQIRILAESTPAMMRLSVCDEGRGIAQEDLFHIFKKFYRSENSMDKQGTGLGLPLAKSIIEGQGGIVSVVSTPGEGSVFTVSFLTKL